ncbi:glycosyltransferase family 39 protein [Vibrio sp. TH_r3]|uniref:ArnT family glycosyltransferase n=1 Tax=Vibrio sp. TH_r3 TaxID=3082084 RepID=UPI0029552EBF|nr:glycosyltransferase family 39 protein [Vibrio sp. TH_r3]MDV7105787.1 glycosyltransferase family 39 protein [Vibrio sp. TH_r3]
MINRLSYQLFFAIIVVVLIRVLSLQLYPLMDTTEARYGEMARIMVETNNWITPQFDYNVPFWGKPPMQTWVSAISGKALGISEFSLRLPHLLSGVLTLAFVGYFAKVKRVSILLTMLTLVTTVGFYIASGAIMTDSLLTLSMTISMLGFYQAWENENRYFAYLGFVGIGLGLLIKGPIIIVLVGLTVLPWIIVNEGLFSGIAKLWKRIPLISGFAVSALIAVPWYLLAEQTTPGFLDYFLIGEHWSRFTVSGWTGDLYGSAHDEVRGTIWLFWLYTAFPWSLLIIYMLVRPSKRRAAFKNKSDKRWHSFLLFWLVSPMALFSFAGNILPMYVLPGVPALALFIASVQKNYGRVEYVLSSIAPLAVCLLIIFGSASLKAKSDKSLLSNIDNSIPVYYLNKRSFSGRFYTKGQAQLWNNETHFGKYPYFMVVTNHQLKASVIEMEGCALQKKTSKRSLYLCLG